MSKYIFANVGRGNIFRQIRAFGVVKSLGKTYGRRGWCEIGESDGKIDEPYRMRLSFPKKKWNTYFVGTHVPITLPKWQKADVKRIFAAKGKAGTFPNKYWVVAYFREEKVVLWNGHLPPGAFNGKNDKNERYRLEAWNEMWDMMKTGVADDMKNGWSAVVMCDANRQAGMPRPHKDSVVACRHKTDYIFACPAPGKKAVLEGSGTKELKIDFHRALWANIKFKKL